MRKASGKPTSLSGLEDVDIAPVCSPRRPITRWTPVGDHNALSRVRKPCSFSLSAICCKVPAPFAISWRMFGRNRCANVAASALWRAANRPPLMPRRTPRALAAAIGPRQRRNLLGLSLHSPCNRAARVRLSGRNGPKADIRAMTKFSNRSPERMGRQCRAHASRHLTR